MPGSNQFLALGTGAGANTLTPTAWAALTTLLANGFQSGVANSQQFNTAFRQTTTMAAAIGQLIADQGVNAMDDGSVANLKTSLKGGLDALYAPISALASVLSTSAFTGSNQSMANSGYQKLPGGLILQWARVTGNGTKTFPTTFPNNCFAVICASAAVAGVSSVCHTNGYPASTSSFYYTSENVTYSDGFYFALGN